MKNANFLKNSSLEHTEMLHLWSEKPYYKISNKKLSVKSFVGETLKRTLSIKKKNSL